MRTKALLLTAALGLAAASTQAQVYSANAVGYVNLSLTAGFNFIANPLKAADDQLGTVLPLSDNAAGATLSKWNPASSSFDSFVYLGGGTWFNENNLPATLEAGEGAILEMFIDENVTFVGEVQQGNLSSTVAGGGAFSLLGSEVPQALPLGPGNGTLGFPADAGGTVSFWTGSGYDQYTYLGDGVGWLTPALELDLLGPVLPVARSFFYQRLEAGNANWARTFSVN